MLAFLPSFSFIVVPRFCRPFRPIASGWPVVRFVVCEPKFSLSSHRPGQYCAIVVVFVLFLLWGSSQ